MKDLVFYQFEKKVNVKKVKEEFEFFIDIMQRKALKFMALESFCKDEIDIDE